MHLFAQSNKPNIIFILVDDQGYGDIGAFFQNQRAQLKDRSKPIEFSPNIDKLAASGAMLMQDYSSAPVCAPSRASIMLGQSQGHSNVRNNQFDKALEDNYTMPSTLRTLGYTTIAVGKWGLQGNLEFDGTTGTTWPAKPQNRGFDHFFGYMRHMDGHEHYPKEAVYYKKNKVEVWDDDKDISSELDKCYTADLWTAYAKKWITDYEVNDSSKQPFFMYLAYETPHAVLELPTQAYPAGTGINGGLQWIGNPHHMVNTASGKVDSYIRPEYDTANYEHDQNPATPEVPWPDTYKRYAMANRRIDDAVGDLLQLLKDLKIDDNTLVIYTSDNGPSMESYLPKNYVPNHPTFFASYDPFDGIKRDSWDGGIHMPTIAVWTGHIAAGKKIYTPTITYDWAATFTDAAGFPAPARMDGISSLPLLIGKGTIHSQTLYSEYYEGGITPGYADFAPSHRNRQRNQMQWIRIGDYTGVRYDIRSQDDDFEIYNLISDPSQRNNLAKDTAAVSVLLDDKVQRLTIPALQRLMKDKSLQMRRPNTSAERPYDNAYLSGIDIHTTLIPGVNWQFYKGHYPWRPQVSTLKADKRGELKQISVPRYFNRQGVYFYEGMISVQEKGTYTIMLETSSNSLLRIHDALVIDADHGCQSGTKKTATIRLDKGWHPFRLYFRNNAKETKPVLNLRWSRNEEFEPLPVVHTSNNSRN
ncbi:MAG: sulfatase-like hydrolase/transferase [Chitinophagaceae bacterium]